jgi:hypothetical protein
MSNSNGDNKPVEKERITNAQFEQIQRRREAEFYLDFVKNEATSRIEWIRKLNGGNERKNIDEECEYPDSIGASDYKATYDRLAIANRLVNIFPQECWAMLPDIYETENLSQVTKFEKEWEVLNEELNVLSKMETLDKLCGIGQYGLMLLGFSGPGGLDKPVIPIAEGGKKRKLLFCRPFPQVYCEILAIETRLTSPRYGMPTMYGLKLIDPNKYKDTQFSDMQPLLIDIEKTKSIPVHWTRVQHVADNQEDSELFGVPRLQAIFNNCKDIKKILGADAEGFWQTGFPGLSIETHPNAEFVEFDDVAQEKTKEQVLKYMSGMQRYLALVGMTAKSIPATISDPTSHLEAQLTNISIASGIPLRILKGSEEAKLSSSQDMRTWNKRLRHRQLQFINAYIIRPFINRLIAVGALPTPLKWFIRWPDLNAPTENDRAVTAQKITDGLVKYIQGKVFLLMPPKEYLTTVLGYDLPTVEAVLKAAGSDIKELMEIHKAELKAIKEGRSASGNKNTAKKSTAAAKKTKKVKKDGASEGAGSA